MKYSIILDTEREEEIIVYAHKKSTLTDRIEALVLGESRELIGYSQRGEIVRIDEYEVTCFSLEDGKLYAICDGGEYLRMRHRLYELETLLSDDFIKINQSCIANIKKIKKFDASLSGALSVIFKNGHRDYVSRRQQKSVKERIGFIL